MGIVRHLDPHRDPEEAIQEVLQASRCPGELVVQGKRRSSKFGGENRVQLEILTIHVNMHTKGARENLTLVD